MYRELGHNEVWSGFLVYTSALVEVPGSKFTSAAGYVDSLNPLLTYRKKHEDAQSVDETSS